MQKRRQAVIHALLAATAWLPARPAAGQTGSVSGTVRDEQGRALAGAQVSLLVRPQAGVAATPYHVSTDTLANGSFRFGAVPAGRYQLCAQKGNSDLVNSCAWGGAPAVTVAAAPVAQDMVMEGGHRLKIRVDDSRGVLAANRETSLLGRIFVSILSDGGGFVPMAPPASDGRGKDYEYVVPFGKALKVRVWSDKYDLEDDKGARVDRQRGHMADVNLARGQAFPVVTVRVGGLK